MQAVVSAKQKLGQLGSGLLSSRHAPDGRMPARSQFVSGSATATVGVVQAAAERIAGIHASLPGVAGSGHRQGCLGTSRYIRFAYPRCHCRGPAHERIRRVTLARATVDRAIAFAIGRVGATSCRCHRHRGRLGAGLLQVRGCASGCSCCATASRYFIRQGMVFPVVSGEPSAALIERDAGLEARARVVVLRNQARARLELELAVVVAGR